MRRVSPPYRFEECKDSLITRQPANENEIISTFAFPGIEYEVRFHKYLRFWKAILDKFLLFETRNGDEGRDPLDARFLTACEL